MQGWCNTQVNVIYQQKGWSYDGINRWGTGIKQNAIPFKYKTLEELSIGEIKPNKIEATI